MKAVMLLVTLALAAPACFAIQFDTTPLPSVEVGQSYDQQIVVSGATGTPSFVVGFGSMPEGLTLSSTGRITGVADHTVGPPLGTPNSPNNPNGSRTYSFQVNVQDGMTLIQGWFNITLWAAGATPKNDDNNESGDSCTANGHGGSRGLTFAALFAVLALAASVVLRRHEHTRARK